MFVCTGGKQAPAPAPAVLVPPPAGLVGGGSGVSFTDTATERTYTPNNTNYTDNTVPTQTTPPLPAQERALPEGWSKEHSDTHQRYYFFNHNTNQKCFHRPDTEEGERELAMADASGGDGAGRLCVFSVCMCVCALC